MADVLLSDSTVPFMVALALFAALLVIELVLLLVGLDPFAFFDASPELDVDMDVDAVAADGFDLQGAFGQALSAVGVGKVPTLVVIMILLTAFGGSGLAVQTLAHSLFGTAAPMLAAVSVASACAVFASRFLCRIIGNLVPSVETYAVSSRDLIGRVARLDFGSTRDGMTAQAEVLDRYGRKHSIWIKAQDDIVFEEGDSVLLTDLVDGFYIAAKPDGSR